MEHADRYHGGLVFVGKQDSVLDRFSRIVSSTLEDYGHAIERQSVMNAQQARITANRYLVKLTLETTQAPSDIAKRTMSLDKASRINPSSAQTFEPSQRLEITLCPVDPNADNKDESELLLVVMMYRMVDAYAATYVEWLNPETVLPVEKFLGAFSSVSPRRVRARQQIVDEGPRFAPVDETEAGLCYHYDAISGQKLTMDHEGLVDLTDEEALALAFRLDPRPGEVNGLSPEDEAENDIRRLATWGMTGVVTLMSGPVGLSMAAVNLARGEDFRLNTHVLSLTGLLVMLQSSGALAGAVSYLPL